jgi:hypothetical protein
MSGLSFERFAGDEYAGRAGNALPYDQVQFSALIPGMLLNSRMLLVTTINPSLRASGTLQ